MKKYILPLIVIGIILSFASAVYTPPSATNITLILTPPYSAPSYTNITLTLIGGNAAPEVQNLNILPATPFTTDDLECSFITSDFESDKTNATVRWYNNSKLALTQTLNNNYGNGTVIKSNATSGNTTKSESWLCEIWLYDGQVNSTLVNSSAVTIQNTLPTVTLTSPLDNWTVNSSIKFECSASSDVSISNITLYHNHTGTWQANGTNNVSGTLVSTSFNRTGFATEKSFIWNCYACDSQAACNYSVSNYSLTVDLTKPHINFTNPTPDNNTAKLASQNWAYVNVTTSDTSNNYSAFIDWNKSLAGWWRFEEDNGTYMNDSSTYGNNGSCSGTGCPVWTTGMRGKALRFDGKNDYVQILNSNSLNPSNEIAIEGWIYPKSWAGSYKRFVDKGYGDQYQITFGIEEPTTYVHCRMKISGVSYSISTLLIITLDNWYYIACTYDGDRMRIYVNGVLKVTSSSYPGALSASTNNLGIGSNPSGGENFNGTIDEVKIFNRALSPEEINANYDTGVYRLYHNFTNLSSGNYTYKAYAVDQAGNLNQTETRVLNISYSPQINSISIAPSTAYTNSTLNCSAVYNDADMDKSNITISWYNGSTLYWQTTQFNKLNGEAVNEPLTWLTNKTGLVAYWKFSEENGTVAKDIVGGNNGNLTSFSFDSRSGWVDGKFGKALQFRKEAGSYVDSGNNVSFGFGIADSFSLEVWIKMDIAARNYGAIMGKASASSIDGYMLRHNTGGQLDFRLDEVNATTTSNACDAIASQDYRDSQWHHVVGVLNRTNNISYIYVDGIQKGTADCNSVNNVSNPTKTFNIGAFGTGVVWNGSIDEVRVWNRSLSSAEISTIYNNSVQVKGETWNCTINSTDSQGDAGLPNSTTRIISNAIPDVPEIGGPENATRTIGNSQTLRCANSSDTDGDTINYVFYGGTTTNPTTMLQNLTSTTYAWVTTDGQTYYWRCKAEDGVGGVSGFTAQKTFTENTAPTSVNMVYPVDGSSITNRTPQLNWSVSTDAEGDSITYQINVTCYPSCSADNRLPNSSANQNWTTLTPRLKNFWDDNYYYNWTVRAWDGYEFSTWNSIPYALKLSSLVSLSMINSSVNFSVLSMGETANTTTNNPVPLSIRNDGNSFVSVNMSNETSLLWTSQPTASEYFRYRIDNVTGEEGSFNWTLSTTAWTNVPTSNNTVINYLNYTDATDSAEIEILVTVPPQEQAGTKSSRLVFTGFYVREI